jgi:TorA maturation chaperone TorD
MTRTEVQDDTLALDFARECVYRFLAAALSDPWSGHWQLLFEEESRDIARAAAELLRQEPAATPGMGELAADHFDFAALLERLPRSASELRAEYDRKFGLLLCRECPPYETEYQPAEDTFLRSQQLADIAGFYRAFGLEPSRSRPERPDHVALELEFMAFLIMKKRLAGGSAIEPNEQAEVCADAIAKFFREHLAWWIPAFATGLRRKAGTGFYALVGKVLAALLPLERARLEIPAPRFPLQPDLIEQPEEQPSCAGCAGGI